MTIIAHLKVANVHSLLGDLLISGLGRDVPTEPVSIPASRDINRRVSFPTNHFAVGLQQKVVHINDNLAIAWSGSHSQAQDLFGDLEPLRRMDGVDPAYVQTVLENIETSRIGDLSLIALAAADGRASLITHRVGLPTTFDPAEQVVWSGSGSRTFAELIRQQAANIHMLHSGVPLNEVSESFDLNLLGSLQSEEFTSATGIRAGWGGGFEAARYAGDRITKLENVLAVHFFVRETRDGAQLFWLPDFRHTSYWQNFTVVQAIEHPVNDAGLMLAGRRDVFIVGPPGKPSADLAAFAPPDFHRQDVVMATVHDLTTDDVLMAPSFSHEPTIRFDAPLGTDKVHVSFDIDFVNQLLAYAQFRWQRAVTFGGVANRPQ